MKKICYWSALAMIVLVSCQNKPLPEEGSSPEVLPEQQEQTEPKQPVPILLSASEQKVAGVTNAFGLKVFSSLSQGATQDLLFSPMSLSLDLTLCAGGAAGNTKAQILSAIGLDGNGDAAASYCQKMVAGLVSADPDTQFTSANSVWVHQSFTPAPAFVDYGQTYFDASVRSLDLSVKESLAEINRWCKENTHGLVEKMLDDTRDPQQVSAALLLNALYFKGGWTKTFNLLPEAPFHGMAGDSPAEYLAERSNYGYAETELAQVVSLPYGCGLYQLVIALPHEGVSIGEMAGSLQEKDFFELSTVDPVTVQLPKFALSYSTEDKLIPALEACGITDAFDANKADFSKLLSGDVSLCISVVQQKSVIRVDETGTEAAAVTEIGLDATDVGPDPEIVERSIVANRPFMFALVESSSRSILFLGQKVN